MEIEKSKISLPDVANEQAQIDAQTQLNLKWVGMNDIESRILWQNAALNENHFLPARVQIQVSLDKGNHRGIHMSRLFLTVQEKLFQNPFSFKLLNEILNESLFTHAETSQSARLQVDFEIPKMQKSLKSGISAMRNYPVTFEVRNLLGQLKETIELKVLYSSTCPASAALSRQLIQNHFHQEFAAKKNIDLKEIEAWLASREGMIATPHAQRSWAKLKFQAKDTVGRVANSTMNSAIATLSLPQICENLIEEIESILGTPVQSAVKRVDEQEFARLNSENMMFCEDAARKLKGGFESHPLWKLLSGEVHHVESLHPHEAVAIF